ncbi:uncharacterized protein LOC141857452 [Brevipalpus obovatus]|uniref:uncharacterized protein LOC141857452 n=1 Tax=Brevipalpus obovatus TaxID=246614 RepID=UPI003D9F40C3
MSSRNKVSKEVRALVLSLFRKGEKQSDIAAKLELNYNTVRSIVFSEKKFGGEARPRGHRKPKLNSEHIDIDIIKSKLDDNCLLTREDLADMIEENFNISRSFPIPGRRNDPSVIHQRPDYGFKFLDMDRDRNKIFFIDETGIQVHARLNYGWSKKGGRANVPVQAIRGRHYSICAAMNCQGLFFYQLREKGYGTDSFVEYLKEFIEKLASSSIENAYIVMDNVPFRHTSSVSDLFSSTSHELVFLPPYSLFLNPIKNLFNKLKHYVKKLRPSTHDEVFSGVELASRVITAQNCANYYSNMMKYISLCLQESVIEN